MGKLLLQHLQKAVATPDAKDLPIKNTFIHFGVARHRSAAQQVDLLPRSRTAPCPQVCRATSKSEPEYEPFLENTDVFLSSAESKTTRFVLVENCGSASTSDAEESETDQVSIPSNPCNDTGSDSPIPASVKEVPTPAEVASDSPIPEPVKEVPTPTEVSSDVPVPASVEEVPTPAAISEAGVEMPEPSAEPMAKENLEDEQVGTTWLVDGRKLKGRDTRVSTVLRLLVGAGPASVEIVATIFPLPLNQKRGGACFKASNSVGRIQLKCNTPIDEELSVSITSGNATQVQKHNFMTNPLMSFDGEWDFKTLIDSNADRPVVALKLHMCLSAKGEGSAMTDPAIKAFSISSMSNVALEQAAVQTNAEVPGLKLTSLPPVASPTLTPDVSPRCLSPLCPSSTGTQSSQAPSTPPFFALGSSVLFSFSLRRADGYEAGLEVARDESNQELVVEKVIPGGAVESWNRQCFQGPCANKALVPSDRIVGVNSRTDCAGMLEECRNQQLLKIFVVRGDLPHYEIPFGWCGGVPAVAPPPVQFIPIPVPIFYSISESCAKHGLVGYNTDTGTFFASSDQLVDPEPTNQEGASCTLRANAPEFCPSAQQQDGEPEAKSDDGA